MATCLVTTLKEAVSDESLLKLGEIRFDVAKGASNYGNINIWPSLASDVIPVKLINSHFVSSDGTGNLGTERNVTQQSSSSYFTIGDNTSIIVGKKDRIWSLDFGAEDKPYLTTSLRGIEVNFDDFAGMSGLGFIGLFGPKLKGDIDTLAKNLPRLSSIHLHFDSFSTAVYGSLDYLLQNLKGDNVNITNVDVSGNLNLTPNTIVYLILTDCGKGITGNLAELKAKPNLARLVVRGSSVSGSLSDINGKAGLIALGVAYTNVTGNLNQLTNMPDLDTLDVSGTSVVGDTSYLANLPKLRYFWCYNTAITGTWPLV